MERVRSGDRDAFHPIIERYQDRIASYFRRHGVPPDLVSDLTQETMFRLFDLGRRESFRDGHHESVAALLHLIAGWVRTDEARREVRRSDTMLHLSHLPPDDGMTVDEEMQAEETARVVKDAIGLLPEKLREVVALHYLEGETLRKVARRTGKSQHAIKRRLQRAREQLHIQLEDYWKGLRHDQF